MIWSLECIRLELSTFWNERGRHEYDTVIFCNIAKEMHYEATFSPMSNHN
jgi:hypothetical protein